MRRADPEASLPLLATAISQRKLASMLDALRRGSTGIIAKLLFGILVLSFAIWGVADVFTGAGQGSLAKVGGQEIRVEDFQRSYQNELRVISQQAGQRITPEQARAAGLDNRVLAQLIAWAAVETHARNLDLGLSDQALADAMMSDPSFKGPDGKFSRMQFENILNQLNLSERGFLALRRRDELREQITNAIINGVAVPDAMIDLINSWREEKRVVDYFNINADKITVPPPDDAKLKATYEANKGEFSTPEYRKLGLLVLSVDSLKGKMDVSDAEAQANYEDTKQNYNIPERRRVQQIAFKDRAAAEAAKKAIAGGKSFGDVAKEAGAKDADIDLGLISKDKLIDPKIADAVFSLQKDAVSDVIEGRFATVIVRVSDIQPAVTRTYADVKDEVRDKVAKKKATDQLQTVIDQVEDNRSAGKPLKDIASEMKLEYLDVPGVDRFNKAPDADRAAINLPDSVAVINAAFESQPGVENEPIELRDGGFVWFDVLDVTEKKVKPFDQVKEEVRKVAINNERTRLIAELANKLIERADKGEAMATLATEAGAPKAETSQPFTRTTEAQGLPKDAVTKAFTLAKDRAGSALTADAKTRVVFKVTQITPAPAPTTEQRDKIVKDLRNQLADETLSEYVIALQKQLGTHINEKEFKRATGAETQ
jgi:peptidyl-prolyl cis-trans isomerase D